MGHVETCWAQSGGHEHTADGKCPYVCPACGCRRMGALGHGRPCSCDSRERAPAIEVTLALALGGGDEALSADVLEAYTSTQ